MQYQVYRDGEPVSPVLASENEALAWLHRHQPQSWHYAFTVDGYEIREVHSEKGAR